MLDIDKLKDIAAKYSAEVRTGDYPYCAWNNNETFNSGKWSGQFFSNEVKRGYKATIYVTDDLNPFGFFHELGHVKDYISGKTFINTWSDEVSAWCNAVEFMQEYGIVYSDNDLYEYLQESLATYTHNTVLWVEAMNKIFPLR